MQVRIEHTTMNRTAKYFIDSGRAASMDDAIHTLQGFGLTIRVGPEVATSLAHQVALLSLVNAARRTFLGGVNVEGIPDASLLTPLVEAKSLVDAVVVLGANTTDAIASWPAVSIGSCDSPAGDATWQLTWEGWRGGVVPPFMQRRLAEDSTNPLAAALAAAIACAEVFAWHAKDHPMAGKRAAGLSLWDPTADWLADAQSEPELQFLPGALWLIGLGNLGQAFAWSLGCLPYAQPGKVRILLQDFDEVAVSNDSTSLLASLPLVGEMKTRIVARWLERVGFATTLDERRFGPWTTRGPDDPAVALCGVDNAAARTELEKPGFGLVIEAGLGGGPDGFRNFALHTFPGLRRAEQVWPRNASAKPRDVSNMPAYEALRNSGMDACGLAQLASRTVGVPFVGLIAAALAISETLRRLHGGVGIDFASGSALDLTNVESSRVSCGPYSFGHVNMRYR